MPPANISLRFVLGLGFSLAALLFGLVKARLQHAPCRRTVLVLRPIVLALHHNAGGFMGQTDRGVRFIDVLAAGAGRAVGIHTDVVFLDFDINVIINHCIDPSGCEASMAAGG